MDISSNPWIINQADTVAGPLIVWPLAMMLKYVQIEFTGYLNATDNATINQANGKQIAYLRGAADLETVRTGILPGYFNGIVIPQNGIAVTGTIRIFHP
jgi:hypothetical protein